MFAKLRIEIVEPKFAKSIKLAVEPQLTDLNAEKLDPALNIDRILRPLLRIAKFRTVIWEPNLASFATEID